MLADDRRSYPMIFRIRCNSVGASPSAGCGVVAGAELKSVEAFSPVRPLTHAAFSAVTYAGRLALCLNAHPSALRPRKVRNCWSDSSADFGPG